MKFCDCFWDIRKPMRDVDVKNCDEFFCNFSHLAMFLSFVLFCSGKCGRVIKSK